MAVQMGTNPGEAFAENRDRLLHRALEAEKQCDQIRESARHWKRRAIEAEKQRDELQAKNKNLVDELTIAKKTLDDVRHAHSDTCGQLDLAFKALDDAQKQLRQAREDLRSANEDYQAQHLELLAVKANAYDLLTGGGKPTFLTATEGREGPCRKGAARTYVGS